MADNDPTNLTALTVDLLSAYFANNTVDSAALSGLIRSTHDALKGIDSPVAEMPSEPEFKAAVSVRKSLASHDHIISLIDGKPYKTLKRHLAGHGLTPAEYRERYKLPRDYPMVSPSYSQQRREVAAKLGLGRKPQTAPPTAVEPAAEMPVTEASPPSPKPKAATKAKGATKALAAPKQAAQKTSAPSAETSAAPAEVTAPPEAAAPKKRGPKPKVVATAPAEAATKKPAAKRAPRKPKDGPDPAAN